MRTCRPATSAVSSRLAYGESPYGYLMTRRIERAMALLRRGDLSVTEVCFAVGCSSLGTFSTRFTELVGVPPSTYRRERGRPGARCRPAWRSRSPDRSGIEKPGVAAAASVTGMDITIHTDLPAARATRRHRWPSTATSLGFEVRHDVGQGGMRWITVGPADQPGTSIVLRAAGGGPRHHR